MRSIVALILIIVAIATKSSADPQAGRTTWDGVYTEAQAARGAATYARACAQCHGPALTGADGPPLAGVEFTSNWNALSLGELFDRVRTSMPPDDPSKLSAQEKVDVLAHMLAVNKFPAGSTELSRDVQILGQVKFLAAHP